MKLATKLTLLFLLLTTIPLAVVGYLAYDNGRIYIAEKYEPTIHVYERQKGRMRKIRKLVDKERTGKFGGFYNIVKHRGLIYAKRYEDRSLAVFKPKIKYMEKRAEYSRCNVGDIAAHGKSCNR